MTVTNTRLRSNDTFEMPRVLMAVFPAYDDMATKRACDTTGLPAATIRFAADTGWSQIKRYKQVLTQKLQAAGFAFNLVDRFDPAYGLTVDMFLVESTDTTGSNKLYELVRDLTCPQFRGVAKVSATIYRLPGRMFLGTLMRFTIEDGLFLNGNALPAHFGAIAHGDGFFDISTHCHKQSDLQEYADKVCDHVRLLRTDVHTHILFTITF